MRSVGLVHGVLGHVSFCPSSRPSGTCEIHFGRGLRERLSAVCAAEPTRGASRHLASFGGVQQRFVMSWRGRFFISPSLSTLSGS